MDNEQRKHIAETLKVSSSVKERVSTVTLTGVALEHTFLQTVHSAVDFLSIVSLKDDSSSHGPLSHHGSSRGKECDWL